MKKQLFAVCLSLTLLLPYLPSVANASVEKVNTYLPGQFTDVAEGCWYTENVKNAYEYGIMEGIVSDYFDVNSNITLQQTVVIACRLHSRMADNNYDFTTGTSWYQPYLDYALKYQITSKEEYIYSMPDKIATRVEFAVLMARSIPDRQITMINDIVKGSIPDVPESAEYADYIYPLYQAGILTGNDVYGTFTPMEPITRGAAAAIATRVAIPSLRKTFTLQEKIFTPISVKNLQNLNSLKKKCTNDEFQAAYDAALKIVTPLAGDSIEDQLSGITIALRELYDKNITYTTEQEHYNDPYGYFVLGVASCAGCTRAAGLCLNILGIPYEHVNESQWKHQWCRVKVGDTYWIVDVNGFYYGPEPAPYLHPYLNPELTPYFFYPYVN